MSAQHTPGPQDAGDFIQKTNEEYAAWCQAFYVPEALDSRGMVSLHGLWAWQEQERRMRAAIAKVAGSPS